MGFCNKCKDLHELGTQCRILSLLTLVVFGFAAAALIFICISALGDPPKYPMAKLHDGRASKTEIDNVTLLITMTVLSILTTLSSISMLVATFNSNMWMTIPYWLMILALIGEYLYQLFYYGFCIGKCGGRNEDLGNKTDTTAFTNNVVGQGGGSYIVSSLFMLALLSYAFVPSFAFFWQCKNKRSAEKP